LLHVGIDDGVIPFARPT